MLRYLAAVVLAFLIAIPTAQATRTESTTRVPASPKARHFYDTTLHPRYGTSVNHEDQHWVTKHGYDGRNLAHYMWEPFDQGAQVAPTSSMIEIDGTARVGTSGTVHLYYGTRGNVFQTTTIGTQTLFPANVTTGLDLTGDLSDSEGYEIASHTLMTSHSPFSVGTTPPFYFQVSFTNTSDASGTDDFQCGLRAVENGEQGWDDYNDAAALGYITGADPSEIYVQTILNAGTTGETDTTDTLAVSTATVWRFNVSAAGVTTFLIDGAAPSTTAAFTFDNGESVHPFCRILNTADGANSMIITDWKAGIQWSPNG